MPTLADRVGAGRVGRDTFADTAARVGHDLDALAHARAVRYASFTSSSRVGCFAAERGRAGLAEAPMAHAGLPHPLLASRATCRAQAAHGSGGEAQAAARGAEAPGIGE
eukprot:COSAG01_NODE_1235_length_11106_cov_3.058962_8_plen_109_part_00